MRILGFSLSLFLFTFFLSVSGQIAHFRAVHGVTNGDPVSLYLNTTSVGNLTFGEISDYHDFAPGPYSVFVNGSVVQEINLGPFQFVTLVLTGDNSHVNYTLHLDNLAAPAFPTDASFTFFHGISYLGAVELRFNDFNWGAQVSYSDFAIITRPASGNVVLSIYAAGTNELLSTKTFSLVAGSLNTGYAVGASINITLANITDITYSYFTVRASHGVAGAKPVNVNLYNPVTNSNQVTSTPISFGTFSQYTRPLPIYIGQTVVVTDSTTNEVLLRQSAPSVPNTVVTLAIVSNGTIQYLPLQDDNTPADVHNVRVRFLHAVAGVGPVNVLVNGNVVFTDVSLFGSTLYASISSSNENSVVQVSVNGVVALTTVASLVSGGVYTIAAYGPAGADMGLFVNNDAQYDYVFLRFANAVPNVPVLTIDVAPSTVPITTSVNFAQATGYYPIVIRNYTVTFTLQNSKLVVNPSWTKNTVYTVAVIGIEGDHVNAPTVSIFTDAISPPASSDVFSVRTIHAAPGIPAVTFYGNGQAIFNDVAYGQASAYSTTLPGNTAYTIVAKTGNETRATSIETPVGGGVYTLFLVGGSTHNATYTVAIAPAVDAAYTYASVRVVHAVPDAGATAVSLNDLQNPPYTIPEVSFKSVTGYTQVPITGFNYTVKLEAFNFSTVVSLEGSKSYTIAAVGYANKTEPLQIVLLEDLIVAPTGSSSSNIRIVHLAPGAPNVNVYLNSQPVNEWLNLAYKSASAYSAQSVVAPNNRFDVFVTGSSTNVLTVSNVAFAGGEVTSIFVFGGNTLAAGLTNDKVFSYFNLRLSHAAPLVPTVQTVINGNTITASYGVISNWTQAVNAGTLSVTIDTIQGAKVIQKDVTFKPNTDTTLILAGLDNTTFPIDLVTVANEPAAPSSNQVSKLRVSHLVPGFSAVNVGIFNTSYAFNNISYLTVTDYLEVPQGVYLLEIFTVGGQSVVNITVSLAGGHSYTYYAEGLYPNVKFVTTVDFFPPNVFYLRVLHASPTVGSVDALVDGSSFGFNSLNFGTDSPYVPLKEGSHSLLIQAANQIVSPKVYVKETVNYPAYNSYSAFFVGSLNGTNSSALTTVTLLDDLTLPLKAGDVRVRFVHASFDAPAVTVKANGVELFSGVQYKSASNYSDLTNDIYTFEVLVASTASSVLSSPIDLRVQTPQGRAVYTIVAEGMVNPENGAPGLKLYAFLDNGEGNPNQQSSSAPASGLSGVAIGLIIAGVAAFVILVATVGFVFWKRRQQRAGYSPIESRDQ